MITENTRSDVANKTTIHIEAIYKGIKDLGGDTNIMISSTEWFVSGICCILAAMLTFLSCEAFIPASFLALPFAIIWKPVLWIFIVWFLLFYALAYKLKK
jgi:hypothetical protein